MPISQDDQVIDGERYPRGFALWMWWVAATTAGWAICGALIGAAIDSPYQVWQYAFVPLTAVGQWLVLRRRFARPERWILATIAGSIVAGAVYAAVLTIPESLLGPADSGARQGLSTLFDGLAIGTAQWLVLRAAVPGAVRWIPATAGPIWLFALLDLARGTAQPEGLEELTTSARVELNAIGLGMVGLLVGIATGAVLMRLVQPSRLSSLPGEATE